MNTTPKGQGISSLFETSPEPVEGQSAMVSELQTANAPINNEDQASGEPILQPDGQEDEFKDVDNPKSYKFFQSKFTKEREERIRAEERARLLEEMVNQKVKPVQEEVYIPEKPKPLKPKPKDFSMTDVSTDPLSESAIWYNEKLEYDLQKSLYDDYITTEIEKDRTLRQKDSEFAQQKAGVIGEYMKLGVEAQEAENVFKFMADPNNFTFDKQLAYYKFLNNKPESKANVVKERTSPQFPLAATPGQAEPQKNTTTDFFDGFKKTNLREKIFKTI